MTVSVAFVQAPSSGAAVRLDLSADPYMVGADIDLSPPALKRSLRSSMLVDGQTPSASAFDNRTIGLPIEIASSSTATTRAAAQALYRELALERNWLRIVIDGTTFYFHTYRAPDAALEVVAGRLEYGVHTLSIPAEPFAYGDRVSTSTTLSSNPAVSGLYLDVTGVAGDVETPLVMRVSGASIGLTFVTGVRRDTTGLTPVDDMPKVIQAETGTPMDDTALAASNSANMSGSGNNYLRTTPSASLANYERVRISLTDYTGAALGASGRGWRGRYRVFVKVRRNTDLTADWRIGFTGDPVAEPTADNTVTWAGGGSNSRAVLDLGLLALGEQYEEYMHSYGYYLSGGITLRFYAARMSGTTATLDWDWIAFVPADDALSMTTLTGASDNVLDAMQQRAYLASGSWPSSLTLASWYDSPEWVGQFPHVSPGVTNRLVIVPQVSDFWDVPVAQSHTVEYAYFPRYLTVA